MNTKVYNRYNFFKHTFCVFKEVPASSVEAKLWHHQSKSGSSYYFVEDGVYRLSNHWGRAANCRWRLDALPEKKDSRLKVGFALWTDFFPNNDQENLFYVAVDYATETVSFEHKLNSNYDQKAILRNSSETMAVVKQMRSLFETTVWAKHILHDDINVLRKEILEQLIYCNKTFLQIKREIVVLNTPE
ncbi:hypothetical protein [Flavobacterium sp. '19STA2R22 D10 B1']|uniref:hypothetical protein n=1 Tax=Flavobacterium aerium TaxID=3037261 RepID=UPI00278BAE95|nr:hypothetical protein [Flavobacterium sp. '19STA2R22 D10 B1']